MNKKILILLFVALSLNAYSQSDSTQKKIQTTPLPILLYNPYTGFGYGALLNTNFLLGDINTTRFSNAQAYVVYTTHHQFAAQINEQLFTKDEMWLIQGKVQYLNWPEYTYGIGGHSYGDTPTKELISYKALEFEQRVMRRVGKKNFIGLQLRSFNCWNLKSDIKPTESYFDSAGIGNKKFNSTGIGIHFIHDSRDNVQNSYTGRYLEIAYNPYFKSLGSTQNWTNVRLDYRRFILLNNNEKHSKVLAMRALYEQAFGDVPYMLMPMFGRYNATRGYVQGRYRGKLFFSAEAEYRAHIYKSLGYVVFGSLNGVDEPNGMVKYISPAAGAGIRIMLNKAQRTNLRIDYAMGTNSNSGLYLQVTEMF